MFLLCWAPAKSNRWKGTEQVLRDIPQLEKKTDGATKKVLQDIRLYGKQGLELN